MNFTINREDGLCYEELTTREIANKCCPQMDRLVAETI